MKRNSLLSLIAFAFIFAACSPAKKSTGVWVNKEKLQGKTFNNFFIIVMTADIQAKVQLEKDLEAVVVSRGHKAVKSIDVMPQSLDTPRMPTKAEIVSKVKASGCNAVFIASLLSKDEAVRFTAESTSYNVTAPYYAYSIYPTYAYTGNYAGYYDNAYQTVYRPSYFTQEKTYFIQSNLFDVATEEIMWSAQSEVFDPTSLPRFSKTYIATLMQQLEKEKLLKK